MTLVAFPRGLIWPYGYSRSFTVGTACVLDADTDKAAFIGRIYWAGRASSKTIDTSGSSAISWQGGSTAVFDNAASTLDVGIQGVSTTGPVAQPDGSYSVKGTCTTAADATPTLTTTNSWHTKVPDTGTVTLSHGDLTAVVWDMTNQAGADVVHIVPGAGVGLTGFPVTNAFASGAWQTAGGVGAGEFPNVILTASDGTLGWIDGPIMLGNQLTSNWSDSDNPDERGMIFQVPFDCKIDALWTMMRTAANTSDFTLILYETPETAVNALATVTVDAAQYTGINTEVLAMFMLASEITLTRDTDYCVAVKATGASNVRFTSMTLGAAGHRATWPASTTMRSVSRNGSSGNFGSSSTTVMHPMGVRISQVDDGDGTGGGSGGGLKLVGTGGLAG